MRKTCRKLREILLRWRKYFDKWAIKKFYCFWWPASNIFLFVIVQLIKWILVCFWVHLLFLFDKKWFQADPNMQIRKRKNFSFCWLIFCWILDFFNNTHGDSKIETGMPFVENYVILFSIWVLARIKADSMLKNSLFVDSL